MGKVRAGLGLTGLTAAGCALLVAGGTYGASALVDGVHHLATTPAGGVQDVQVDEYPEAIPESLHEPHSAASDTSPPPSPAPDDWEEVPGPGLGHLECTDPEALAVKEQHNAHLPQPDGWPSEWDGTGPMPDPECHPDYLEIGEWVHFEEFHASWEGIETSSVMPSGDAERDNANLWEQSLARAEWSEEQWNG